MIIGIGNDIISTARIKNAIDQRGRPFIERIFTPLEQEYCEKHRESFRNYAGRFAAKEAVVKAFGSGFTGGVTWLDIEIRNDPSGKPHVFLSDKLKEMVGKCIIHLSISHCDEYAAAIALVTST